ncbi:expressed unknown protein [Seminavis robusta]|uniref:Uncharacterized protein n=1 Tax=Seminavis robusta TaxID=568900 RepID=A0A9N8H5A0_9STRA|nr:expressed unknown protein [Seminavis robusta]|eukprot:Sro20_g014060.1 n/a (416) ;mRNA; r:72811-74058
MSDNSSNNNNSGNNNNSNQKRGSVKKLSASAPLTAKGYVATQQSLTGLVQELLATVKGLRREQKEQKEQIEELTSQLEDQKRLMKRLVQRGLVSSGGEEEPSTEAAATTEATPANLAKLRRELVGMIGNALAQQEEDIEAALIKVSNYKESGVTCQCPCCCSNNNEKMNPKQNVTVEQTSPESEISTPSDNDNEHDSSPSDQDCKNEEVIQSQSLKKEFDDFRTNILPKVFAQRTFHSNGTTMLGQLPATTTSTDATSFIDYPMKMVVSDEEAATDRQYTWSIEVSGGQWAVGIALSSSAYKWEPHNTTVWLLGDKKGEWAYRNDDTLWCNAKQRKKLDTTTSSAEGKWIVTLTLEFQPRTKIVLYGSVSQNQNQQQATVLFEMPWSNFKKPASTAFVPAVSVQGGSSVRFLGWQ